MKKVIPGLLLVCLLLLLATPVFARPPIQTKQGCQTEASDYLVDIIWTEFGPWVYDLNQTELLGFFGAIGIDPNGALAQTFLPLLLNKGTLVAYFGPCCFKGGPITYVDARNNGFPNGCCKPPEYETFPIAYVGGGDGNPCLCHAGLHRTPSGKTYGGGLIPLGNETAVSLDETLYLLLTPTLAEEWVAVPVPNGP